MLTRKQKIDVLAALGRYLATKDDRLEAHVHRASISNPWFTKDNIYFALDSISKHFLDGDALQRWLAPYAERPDPLRRVGLIAAGNVPLVGFHDVLSVFMSGNITRVKISDRDPYLIPYLIQWLNELEPRTSEYFELVDRLSDFDAVIATGSNNSARYFIQYFGKYPNIIRKNRNAVAVLHGDESEVELDGLCQDIFRYFGLGCRSVSHLYIPRGYNFASFQDVLRKHEAVANHSKFRNNLDYNTAIFVLNREPHIASPNLLLVEKPELISPVGCLYYSYYDSTSDLEKLLLSKDEEIQCVVSSLSFEDVSTILPGDAQHPRLDDYADGINTIAFLYNFK